MRQRLLWGSAAPAVIVSCSLAGAASCARATDPDVQPAVAFLASAVHRHRLLAIGEHYGSTETKDLLAALLRHQSIPGTISDIVVEFGKARYQDVMDAYVAGETVALNDLRGAWEHTSQLTGVWLSPIYLEKGQQWLAEQRKREPWLERIAPLERIVGKRLELGVSN